MRLHSLALTLVFAATIAGSALAAAPAHADPAPLTSASFTSATVASSGFATLNLNNDPSFTTVVGCLVQSSPAWGSITSEVTVSSGPGFAVPGNFRAVGVQFFVSFFDVVCDDISTATPTALASIIILPALSTTPQSVMQGDAVDLEVKYAYDNGESNLDSTFGFSVFPDARCNPPVGGASSAEPVSAGYNYTVGGGLAIVAPVDGRTGAPTFDLTGTATDVGTYRVCVAPSFSGPFAWLTVTVEARKLAETGTDATATWTLASGAAALLVVGFALLRFRRRITTITK